MIVDTSAVVAIIRGEAARDRLITALAQSGVTRMSAGTYLELGIVVDRLDDPVLTRRLEALLGSLDVEVVDVTREQVDVARQAYRDFGRGSGHAARLNFGDCFAYALAATTGEPLLFVGDDFGHTDLRPALV